MHEAKTQVVAAGRARRGRRGDRDRPQRAPVARLVPVARTSSFSTARGVWKGQVRIAEDFDALPDDLADALGAR